MINFLISLAAIIMAAIAGIYTMKARQSIDEMSALNEGLRRRMLSWHPADAPIVVSVILKDDRGQIVRLWTFPTQLGAGPTTKSFGLFVDDYTIETSVIEP